MINGHGPNLEIIEKHGFRLGADDRNFSNKRTEIMTDAREKVDEYVSCDGR